MPYCAVCRAYIIIFAEGFFRLMVDANEYFAAPFFSDAALVIHSQISGFIWNAQTRNKNAAISRNDFT